MATTEPGATVSPSRRRYDAIDGLRCVAAFTILVHHFLLVHRPAAWLLPYAHHLEVGVPVFFVISGFVLYRPWVDIGPGGLGARSVVRYARRRVTRIVPAFWLALSIAVLAKVSTGPIGDKPWIYYGFLQVYSMHTFLNGLSVAWSLGPETTYYIILPALALLAARLRPKTGMALAAAIVLLAFVVRYIGFSQHAPALSFTLAGTVDWFVIGMAFAVITVRLPGRVEKVKPGLLLATAVVLFGVMAALDLPWGIIANNVRPTAVAWLAAHLFYGLIAALACAAAISAEDRRGGLVPRFLHNRAVLWLGTVSYGIYLWHVPVLFEVLKLVGHGFVPRVGLAQFLVVVAGTVAVASLSWVLLERPLLRWRPGRRASAVAPPAVESAGADL